jgi:hypothetical protein
VEDILNIRGEKIPELPPEVSALVEEGRHREVKILEGASSRIFGGRVPHARTHVAVRFEDEENLITCVRLLRWSDDRLIALGSSIEWAWNFTVREGMEIRFAVDWHDPEFYRRRRGAIEDRNHLSYFKMFAMSPEDFEIRTEYPSQH